VIAAPVQPFIATASLNTPMAPAPVSKPALRERVTVRSEPPAMPVLTAPIQPSIQPMIADAPLNAPIAPAPIEKPAQLPARTSEEFAGATITVQTGDSLWKLAERYLGKAERWIELAKNNPQLENPSLIRPGDPIHLPLPVQPRADLKKIIIRRGDTLWSVAQAEFGQPLAFACIAHANPQLQSANVIRAGQTLVLPEACALSR
jgi:nucleoid-associated protein YgaU